MTQEEFAAIASTIPLQPGIYKYYDGNSDLLYVGKAKFLLFQNIYKLQNT